MICLFPINNYYVNIDNIDFLVDKNPAIGKPFCQIGVRTVGNFYINTDCEIIKKQIYKTCKDN